VGHLGPVGCEGGYLHIHRGGGSGGVVHSDLREGRELGRALEALGLLRRGGRLGRTLGDAVVAGAWFDGDEDHFAVAVVRAVDSVGALAVLGVALEVAVDVLLGVALVVVVHVPAVDAGCALGAGGVFDVFDHPLVGPAGVEVLPPQ